MESAGPVFAAPGRPFDQRNAGTPLATDSRMMTMMSTPELTLVFLLVVVSLGIAFVWMIWEMEQMTKTRLAKVRRHNNRFG